MFYYLLLFFLLPLSKLKRNVEIMRIRLFYLLFIIALTAHSEDLEIGSASFDTEVTQISHTHNDTIQINQGDSIPKNKSFFKKFIDYFGDANKNKKNKKFDFSIIGGPHYSTDTKFGLGLVGAGLYRMDRNDTILPPSNVSLFSDVSTVGFYLIGIRGNNLFPKDRFRLNYTRWRN